MDCEFKKYGDLDSDEKKFHHHGNLSKIIDITSDNLDYAYSKGIMTLYAESDVGRSVKISDGRIIVDYARGSYLGLDNHPDVVDGAIKALETYRSLQWSGARTRLNFAIMKDLEDNLSDLTHSRAMVFSLVATANMAVIPLLASGAFTNGNPPVVVFDKFAHATLSYHKAIVADNTRVITIEHNDIDALESICQRHSVVAYVADGVYSMGGSAPIEQLRSLQDKYGLFLYIDDAHGISIHGVHGEGYARSRFSKLLDNKTIIAASLSKGFGTNGGFLMLGTREQEMLLRRYAIPHTFSMGPSVPSVGAAISSANIHRTPELHERQERLRSIIAHFDKQISSDQAGEYLPIRMITIGDERKAIDCACWLLDKGYFVVPALFPSVPRNHAALRICLTSDHDRSEIEGLCTEIKNWLLLPPY
ncbi:MULTISPECIES: aminotransferase class I/II-fold pyridoxal phosphate-dependent enzyme [Serratia]|uniref:aminotransferase class I/II-fold pyridoxal phosphate-dependent enzyme n=1 Tax=Serratia TaxID=613 RepID=UPI0005BA3C04|nr:aminotransferase class I/II-fold pyridoxal phosphate-dependent enzyme [Serratia marcescens]EHT9936654.1 aminotransferase class I/II-fold pyridoxal phosphate-dependent enzyme [Serratia marcescens]EIJ6676224.1 aminotransferase class I/II-fold pyridoxal phosphate-dependent enzyme [Serratia marcescens]HED2348538.1 aminotransferase class I/II-fold pyridoxal phosphate-dependent enzyme [Serratia marcescens]